MTLRLPAVVDDPKIQQVLDAVSQAFPVTRGNLAKNSVGSTQIEDGQVGSAELAKEAATDEKLSSPVVRGQVKSTGGVELGSGFTSERTAEGRYTIKLNTELSSSAIIVATLFGGSGQIRVAATGKKELKVETVNITQTAFQDNAFNFMAIKS